MAGGLGKCTLTYVSLAPLSLLVCSTLRNLLASRLQYQNDKVQILEGESIVVALGVTWDAHTYSNWNH